MPKRISEVEYDAIEGLIAGHDGGVRVAAIRDRLGFALPARTLQRRLSHLAAEGRIVTVGSGKGRLYRPATHRKPLAEIPSPVVRETGALELSAPGAEIMALVTRPLTRRTPVGYQPEFLDAYRPNVTAYLPPEVRRDLAQIGRVGRIDEPAGTYLRQVMDRLLIDLSWNSSRLEGNSYSLLETQRLLDRGEAADGKATSEARMILNHKAAIEMLAEQAEEIGFNRYTVLNLHALLSDSLLSTPEACGRVRDRPVGISGTVFHPLEVPQQIEARFDEILRKADAIEDPYEQAFFMMVQLPYLQPFEDVNKRVSRLAANIPLVRGNLCPLSFVDVPQEDYVNGLLGIYELKQVDLLRDVFVWAYERSAVRYGAIRQSLGKPDPFRLQYRPVLGTFIREVVLAGMDKGRAANHIAKRAEDEIPESDRTRFIREVESELSALHEGSIARFRLRPGEFGAWKAGWR